MNERIPVIELPNDKRSSKLEYPRSGGIVHISQFIAPTVHRALYLCGLASQTGQVPFFDFCSNAALIAARTPSGFLSFGSSARLLMNSVGVAVTPRKSASARSESIRSLTLSPSSSFLN